MEVRRATLLIGTVLLFVSGHLSTGPASAAEPRAAMGAPALDAVGDAPIAERDLGVMTARRNPRVPTPSPPGIDEPSSGPPPDVSVPPPPPPLSPPPPPEPPPPPLPPDTAPPPAPVVEIRPEEPPPPLERGPAAQPQDFVPPQRLPTTGDPAGSGMTAAAGAFLGLGGLLIAGGARRKRRA
jgi:LPXTG-motif cell wall-anchored protein